MAHARGGDFMFCDLCGTMMFLYSKEHVECPLCKFKKSAKGMAHDHLFSSK
jgi:DNA-directed RNA polymerase I subunit RPA12